MKTFAIVNQKGGVAKTTTTFNLATALAAQGHNVLMVDLDPQASLTISTGISPESYGNENICRLFQRKNKTANYALRVDSTAEATGDRLYLIPSDINLAATEMDIFAKTSREKLLKKALKQIEAHFDYCFIDCPPNLGMLTINALTAADEVIVPTKPEYLSYRGLAALFETIEEIKEDEDLNPDLKIKGVIITLYQKIIKDQQAMVEMLKENYPILGIIKQSADAYRSIDTGTPVIISNKKSPLSQAYASIAELL